MLNARNIIYKELSTNIAKPIIPNTDTKNRPPYPFADYSIITNIAFNGEGNRTYGDSDIDILHTLEVEPKFSMSFNAYGKTEAESYNLAKDMWNFFKHIGEFELMLKGITVVDVMDIDNRTMLEVNQYEHRHGFDVIFRYKEKINRVDLTIEKYSIEKE